MGRSSWIKSRAALRLGVTAIVAAACTSHENFELKPDYGTVVVDSVFSGVRPALVFTRGTYADKRDDTTMLATFKQGIYTYDLVAQRPVPDAIFEGLQTLVAKAGHTWAMDSGQVRIDLELLGVEASRNAGLINVGAVSKIQIKLDFVDRAGGRVIYSEIYNGSDSRTQALIGFMGMVKASLNQSIINCINHVGSDPKLAAALRSWRTGS